MSRVRSNRDDNGIQSAGTSVPDTVVMNSDEDYCEISFASGFSEKPGDRQAHKVTDTLKKQGSDVGSVCMLDPETGAWLCRPYKREKLQEDMDKMQGTGLSRKDAILETLQKSDITCYIVKYNTSNMMKDLRSIVDKVSMENRNIAFFDPNVTQRCCLFEDKDSRLFNLVVAEHAVGPAAEWKSNLESFSGTQAMIAFTVLCRSFPCAFDDNIGQLQPAFLSLILGLVFREEISLSWLNASMLVRSMPSVSAHSLTSVFGSDWLRKILTLLLAVSSTATGEVQKYMTISGIFITGVVLLVNLGSRAWYFMKFQPLRYNGPLSLSLGYFTAVIAGMVFPYMGHREIEVGGKRALESVLASALIVGLVFVLSDYDEIQKLIVLGSEVCPQDSVNVVVGVWWTITLLSSMLMVLRIKTYPLLPAEEHLLVPAQESPVGFKVPNLPDFVVDPNFVKEGCACLSLRMELLFGALTALAVGGGIVYLGFTNVDNIFSGPAL